MNESDLYRRLRDAERHDGDAARELRIGRRTLRLEGLGSRLTSVLDRRWGGFVRESWGGEPAATMRVYNAGPGGWLERWQQMEPYRLEALSDGEQRLVVSYHFALTREPDPGTWRLAITDGADEPLGRLVENAVRYITARLAIELGGFALHGAGVLRDGRAYLFAGPSRSGKTTAVELSAPATSLGDDFAMVAPQGDGWVAPAVPFDNAERITADPPEGVFPVAGIWRLHQATRNRIERPPRSLAAASLMGCTAFPWALPELADRLLEHVKEFAGAGHFAHLHFRKHVDFWSEVLQN